MGQQNKKLRRTQRTSELCCGWGGGEKKTETKSNANGGVLVGAEPKRVFAVPALPSDELLLADLPSFDFNSVYVP